MELQTCFISLLLHGIRLTGLPYVFYRPKSKVIAISRNGRFMFIN